MKFLFLVITQNLRFSFLPNRRHFPGCMAPSFSNSSDFPGWSLADGGWELGVGGLIFGCGHFFYNFFRIKYLTSQGKQTLRITVGQILRVPFG